MSLLSLTKTRFYRNFMAKVYGFGAAIVLIGALFKINHYPYADIMLIVGLGTEAIIFFFSAFEPPHVEPDWSLVYPELAGMYNGVKDKELKKRLSPTEQLDEMLKKSQIEDATIERLGEGMEKLSENALKLNQVTDAAVVSEEFYKNLKDASGSAQELSDAFGKEVEATNEYSENMQKVKDGAGNLASTYEEISDTLRSDVEKTNDQLRKTAENLSALNAIYEMQLQGSNQTVESSEQLQVTMTEFLTKLESSTTSAAMFSTQMESLTERMTSLNKVYGNMLSAMNANV
ncbi:MAG: gliding motility protein GldL [Lentimicrobiaceae bacterium]|jgi:gliding motility-associated protein GldL|nr:gliding motility protein GldL [Lentimicrobiaceae bacterium]MCP4911101.1 gliding motility protein GldL [Bacteroidota bacterium]MBT3454649.1 gliding motility protein GldL [Lentimicrobiaceae bacterium]MBT3819746.1 gliding motility protein GldL [Lentimicrobiaceae bacterium]MBT4061175.1 gliding motility protein GldL [Lentimicrobiaceae bacterium]